MTVKMPECPLCGERIRYTNLPHHLPDCPVAQADRAERDPDQRVLPDGGDGA
jgi:hypothetical protein